MDAREYRSIQKILRNSLAEGGCGALVEYMANGDASATRRMAHLIRTCSHFRRKYSPDEFYQKFIRAINLVETGQHTVPQSYTSGAEGHIRSSSGEGFVEFFLCVAILVDEDVA